MEPLRLFIGLWPGPPLRDALVAHQAAWQWPRQARRVPADKLHLTLHFLGDVAPDRVGPLQAALSSVAVPAPSWAVPWASPAGVLWHSGLAVSLLQPDAPLIALHAAVGEVLAAQGLPVEARRYRPHVTLARRAEGALPAAQPPLLPYTAHDIALVASAQGRYTVLSRHGGPQ